MVGEPKIVAEGTDIRAVMCGSKTGVTSEHFSKNRNGKKAITNDPASVKVVRSQVREAKLCN